MTGPRVPDVSVPIPGDLAAAIEMVLDRAAHLRNALDAVPAGRERSIAVTKLDECKLWAVAGLAGFPE